MSTKRIGNTDYYWSLENNQIVLERKRLWIPVVVTAYLLFPVFLIGNDIQWENSAHIFFYLGSFPVVFWFFFQGMGKSTITTNSIKQSKFFGFRNEVYEGKTDMQVKVTDIGGRYPHQEIRLFGYSGEEQLLLALVKDYGVETYVFDELVSEFKHLKGSK